MAQVAGEALAWIILISVVILVVLTFTTIRKVRTDMGVVADTLNTVSSDLVEARDEILGELEKLANKPTLDDADRAALSRVAEQAKGLADIVPNAVTVPLPDPADSGDLDPADGETIDPANPVAEVPAPAVDPVFEAPAEGAGDGGEAAAPDAGASEGVAPGEPVTSADLPGSSNS